MRSNWCFIFCFACTAGVAHASGNLGFLQNDSVQLRRDLMPHAGAIVLNDEPMTVLDPTYVRPRGYGFVYYGDGVGHDGEPLTPWSGAATDVGLVITRITHDSNAVSAGFRMASGEFGAFADIAGGVRPSNLSGLHEAVLIVSSAQIESGIVAGAGRHAHVYFDAAAPGVWDVTFKLLDLGAPAIYTESIEFTQRFIAVPEPAGLLLLGLGLSSVWGVRPRGRSFAVEALRARRGDATAI